MTEPQVPPKPPLPRLPPIWAQVTIISRLALNAAAHVVSQSRQEVCESFEWFRSYQGGIYQNNGTVKGHFLSAFPAKQDMFACVGNIVISHGGGKAASSRTQGGQATNTAADDRRAQDLSVRALIETHKRDQPLVLLIDDRYQLFPFDLAGRGVYMAVLGTYDFLYSLPRLTPSDSHPSEHVVRYKCAFQWCTDQGDPWWAEEYGDVTQYCLIPCASPLTPDNLYLPCATCSKKSPRVYQQAWACLYPACPAVWSMAPGRALPDQLDYNPVFLSVLNACPLPVAYRGALLPEPPVLAPQVGITTTYRYSRGWHCRKCGRLSCSRSAWEQYQCPKCKDTHAIAIVGNVRPARSLMSIRVPISDKIRIPTTIFSHPDVAGAIGRYQTFILPEGKGKIHLIQMNRLANVEADRIFGAYQRQASDGTLLFRRWPLRSVLRGPLLTNSFSQNSGETYHYVGGTDNTVPFDRALAAVIQVRELIEKRVLEALGAPHKFNEVLSAAYMEQQKKWSSFHRDSERGLGPVVAGLSMGSPALMHFRLLSKYTPRDEQRANAMTVVIRHGDVLVMEGAGVQDFYEYAEAFPNFLGADLNDLTLGTLWYVLFSLSSNVKILVGIQVPYNFRIAATARWIAPHPA
ncbi:hypothetical protein FB451DRAFT_1026883 [Mycena latifolia]|nr:hypothetical protein FB451DRAFT_1026883 [Mycena latifolia]